MFPGDLLHSTYQHPENPGELLARTEAQRRVEYMTTLEAQVGQCHPRLVNLVRNCLKNDPEERPSSEVLLCEVYAMKEEVEQVYGESSVKLLDMKRISLAKDNNRKGRRISELKVLNVNSVSISFL